MKNHLDLAWGDANLGVLLVVDLAIGDVRLNTVVRGELMPESILSVSHVLR